MKRCGVYVLQTNYTTSTEWKNNQFAVDFWIKNALMRSGSAWVVSSPQDATVLYVDASINYLCSKGKGNEALYAMRSLYPKIDVMRSLFADSIKSYVPAVWGGCSTFDSFKVTVLREFKKRNSIVVPFVVRTIIKPTHPWPKRKFIFMAGHIPKAYISSIRFNVWQQLLAVNESTIVSSTIRCSYGAFRECASLNTMNKTVNYFRQFCEPFCAPSSSGCSHIAPTYNVFQQKCRAYRDVQFDALPQIFTNTKLSKKEYIENAFNHHFCIVAPGDFLATHKIAESIVIGGMGGCIPVIVVSPDPSTMLPFLRWFDYCKAAVLISVSTATRNLLHIVQNVLPKVNVESKRGYLQKHYRAFVSSYATPSVGDYILAEMCAHAETCKVRQNLKCTPH